MKICSKLTERVLKMLFRGSEPLITYLKSGRKPIAAVCSFFIFSQPIAKQADEEGGVSHSQISINQRQTFITAPSLAFCFVGLVLEIETFLGLRRTCVHFVTDRSCDSDRQLPISMHGLFFAGGEGGADVWSVHPLGFCRIYPHFWLFLRITAFWWLGSRVRSSCAQFKSA